MKILLCDNNQEDLKITESILRSHNTEASPEIIAFNNSRRALNYITSDINAVDIAFLNIGMKQMNGIRLAHELRAKGFVNAIVFLTESNNYAAESYEVGAFSYLLKPAAQSDLQSIVDRYISTASESDLAGFAVRRRAGSRYIRFSELVYIKSDNHHLGFYLRDGEIIKIYSSLREYACTVLADERMVRVSHSAIINRDYIKAYEGGSAILFDDTRIKITKDYSKLKELDARFASQS